MKIKQNGSIWQLATINGGIPLSTNFCHVFWTSLLSLVFITVVVCVVGAYLGSILSNIAALVFLTGAPIDDALGVTLTGLVLVTAVYSTYWIGVGVGASFNWLKPYVKPNEDGFVYNSYKSIKENYCPIVELEKDDKKEES